ncbi:hypothetical protein G5V59_02600 [Nocardioides sp. W3-2-3]|uniref:hypothetical protein n=1 Tax=Nocardioides convexus TaxID=2712224 RepID=UPI002418490A|nr:hypothetical protein [Nocardioides convexus]NGZ99642.1 hypothetical protein [Nocardioides convexus]
MTGFVQNRRFWAKTIIEGLGEGGAFGFEHLLEVWEQREAEDPDHDDRVYRLHPPHRGPNIHGGSVRPRRPDNAVARSPGLRRRLDLRHPRHEPDQGSSAGSPSQYALYVLPMEPLGATVTRRLPAAGAVAGSRVEPVGSAQVVGSGGHVGSCL